MIAIHDRYGSFSKKWIEYCDKNKFNYFKIDLFDSNIIEILREKKTTHLLFHYGTGEYKTDLLLKKLGLVLENEGIRVFPEFSVYWHYDDKLSQKYLFEQLGIPHAPMKVFYSREAAGEWVQMEDSYPFVFKLRGGAGSTNVKLVKNKNQANKLVKKMFGKGIKPVRSILRDAGPTIRRHNKNKDWSRALLRFPKTLYDNLTANHLLATEKGYFLVQTYYPNNDYDTRIAIIGDKACGFRRHVRPNDFRASGSGLIDFDPDKIDPKMIEIAFRAAEKIGSISAAFDFIYDLNGDPKVLEVSYCYVSQLLVDSGGYWDRDLNYHQQVVIPEHEILEAVLS